jgi:hypothetical protein
MDIIIENDVPMPASVGGRGRKGGPLKAALSTMQVGDSFTYPIWSNYKSTCCSIRLLRKRYAPDIKIKMAVETVLVDGVATPVLINDKEHVRVWRVG